MSGQLFQKHFSPYSRAILKYNQSQHFVAMRLLAANFNWKELEYEDVVLLMLVLYCEERKNIRRIKPQPTQVLEVLCMFKTNC